MDGRSSNISKAAKMSMKSILNNSVQNDLQNQRINQKNTKGFTNAKEMLLQSIKKDKTAEKMSFVPGSSKALEANEDIDEDLEELLDQLVDADISDDLLEEYTEIYLIIDPTNDGTIDAPKLFKALHAVGFEPTESEIMDIIDAVDFNKSEKIEFVELVDMMLSRSQHNLTDKELKDGFCLFDSDEDGIISAEDIKPLFSRFGYDLDDEEISDLMLVADYNKDGIVTMEDFVTAVKRQAEKPYKNFDWTSVLNDDSGPVGAAYEAKLEDDYFEDEEEEVEDELEDKNIDEALSFN